MSREEMVARRAQLERRLLGAWFAQPKFRAAWVPEPGLFVSTQLRAIAAVAARDPEVDIDGALMALHATGELTKLFSSPGDAVDLVMLAPHVLDPWAALEEMRGMVAAAAARDALIAATREIDDAGNVGDVMARLSESMAAAVALSGSPVASMRDIMARSWDGARSKERRPGVLSGVGELDAATGGLRHGQVWVIGASTSWGKSSWLCHIASRATDTGHRVLIVSAEDSEELYGRRLLQIRASVNAVRLRDGMLTPDEHERATSAIKHAPTRPFFVSAIRRPVEQVASEVSSLCVSHGIDVVLVDYLQAMRASRKSQDRRLEVDFVARALTDAIKSRNATGILFSQLTTQKGADHPTHEWIRECRDVAHAAEVVLLGYSTGEGAAEQKMFWVDKIKDGWRGFPVRLRWDAARACFLDDIPPETSLGDGFDDYHAHYDN